MLRRCTLVISDPTQNHRLATLSQHYDLLALRPTTEQALNQACALDCDLISLDLTVRFPFHFKHKALSTALQRGVKFEICYAPGILASDSAARRNLISNATQLIRATRGRGIVISSEAKRAVGCRGPWDVINLAAVWGLGQERGREAVGQEARSVVVQAEMRRRSYRGVIDVVYGGEKPLPIDLPAGAVKGGGKRKGNGQEQGVVTGARDGQKRKAGLLDEGGGEHNREIKPVSKREQKRQAKKARLETSKNTEDSSTGTQSAVLVQKSADTPNQASIIPKKG